jgi:hypothetical protein
MEADILRRLAEEEASIDSLNSAASRFRAAAAAAQPLGMSMLNSVRGIGHNGPPVQPIPSAGPSLYDMALLQQRMAMEEQTRLRMMAQAAANMRQQQHLSQIHQFHQHQRMQLQNASSEQQQRAVKRDHPEVPKANKALERLYKKRKYHHRDFLNGILTKEKTSGGFRLPIINGKDVTPSISSLKGFRTTWDRLAKNSKSLSCSENEKYTFIRYHFGKALSQKRCHLNIDNLEGNP